MIIEPDTETPLGLLRRPVVPTVALRPRIELRSERSDHLLGVVPFLPPCERRWLHHLAHLGSLKLSDSGGVSSLFPTSSCIIIGIHICATSSSSSHQPILVEGGAKGNLGPHGQEGAEGDDAQADIGEQPCLPLLVVLVLLLRGGELRPPPGHHDVVINVIVFAANAGSTGAGASEWTGAVGKLQSRFGVDGFLIWRIRHGGCVGGRPERLSWWLLRLAAAAVVMEFDRFFSKAIFTRGLHHVLVFTGRSRKQDAIICSSDTGRGGACGYLLVGHSTSPDNNSTCFDLQRWKGVMSAVGQRAR
mmetsp:Transcript_20446/g.58676  ORF Transcript_20446/g.58676 Transcript_20446/m.58676 type:complete len:303 (-) Transcript_20446:219-1127(-)